MAIYRMFFSPVELTIEELHSLTRQAKIETYFEADNFGGTKLEGWK